MFYIIIIFLIGIVHDKELPDGSAPDGIPELLPLISEETNKKCVCIYTHPYIVVYIAFSVIHRQLTIVKLFLSPTILQSHLVTKFNCC